ncbi:MAG: hypothetical protein K6G33_09975 [Ruminococcus sp.]|uniref:hypothetical protein n=1 Tax=Ruminococcus sp. TaxID=41978 RepID=UPI0025F5A64F|nr:hypothetical protein [Ruminococcus sp.]MCR5601051.1 hypothetical protein [Ruminococcus sp.]
MRSKKHIFAALAAMSVMASAASFNAFAAETDEAAVTTAATTTNAVVTTTAIEVAAPELPVPPVAPAELDDAEKPEAPVIIDVTDFIDQIRSFIEANDIDVLTDTILENWDEIEKVDVHFHANAKPEAPVKADEDEDAEKPEAPTKADEDEDAEKPAKALKPVHLDLTDLFFQFRDVIDASKIDFVDDATKEKILNAKDVHADVHFKKAEPEKPVPPVAPVIDDNAEKPEPPTAPAIDDNAEKPELPTPPAPPVAPDENEKPVPPTPPTPPTPPVAPEAPKGPKHEHLGPKEREALNAAEAPTEAPTEAEISE